MLSKETIFYQFGLIEEFHYIKPKAISLDF